MRIKQAVLTLLACVMSVAAVTFASATYANVARIGPFFTTTNAFDSLTHGMVGGEIRIYKDSTDTLLIGDVVYLARNGKVHKNTTLASYNAMAGVVVGGTRTNMQAANSSANVGDTATNANGRVVVLIRGRTWIKVDSAGVGAGIALIPSTSLAGAAKARTTAIDTFNRIYARTLDTAIAGSPVLVTVLVRP